MSAPRIDMVRRDIKDAIAGLQYLADNLEDVHTLAYNRHKAGQQDKVRGGSRDYALDTHGDPIARGLYEDTWRTATKLIDETLDLTVDLRSFLTGGKGGSRNDRTADCGADEVIAQIEHRRRRRLRGEYEPNLIAKQPVVVASMDWKTECEVLRSAVRKVTAEFRDDHQLCQPPDQGSGRYKRQLLRRYPTKMLSTRERDSWRTAIQLVAAPTPPAAP